MSLVLKNWSPRQVKKFLLKNGFEEIKRKKSGDHCCLCKGDKGDEDYKYTEIDMGKKSFSAWELLSFVKQSGIPKDEWKK